MPAIGTGVSTAKGGGQSWSRYWKTLNSVLFFAETKNIADGKLYNQVTGATDYLTVSGSPATFRCPDNLTYKNADTDELWRNGLYALRTVTSAELVGYDFSSTIIKYADSSPYAIETIMILKAGIILTADQINRLHKDFKLPIYWSGVPNLYGVLKGNRGLSRSVFTPDANIIKSDTFTDGWWKPLDANGARTKGSAQDIWWDMMVGSSTYGPTLTSGTVADFAVYKIITCQANWFYTGNQVGDIFVGSGGKTINAANSVKLVVGNHLSNPDVTKCPVNQTFDGVGMFLRAKWTSNQPTFLYAVVNLVSWSSNRYLFDGATLNTAFVATILATQKIKAYAGTALADTAGLTAGQLALIRVYFNGASSKMIINSGTPTTGNAGAANSGGLTVGGAGGASTSSNFCNETVKEIIRRTSDASEDDIKNYLVAKWQL